MRSKLLLEKQKVLIILPNICNYAMKDGMVCTMVQKKRDKLYNLWLDYKVVGTAYMTSNRELVSLVYIGGYYTV